MLYIQLAIRKKEIMKCNQLLTSEICGKYIGPIGERTDEMIHLTIFHLTILKTQNAFVFYTKSVSSCFSLKAFLISRETEKGRFLY